ncbi:MAG: hypothetical protein EU532_12330 [Promethearchaeota archaeon]|nr:MAG: hypothetical protein EU532_12330 [Candidatus Lokiarchaeota archaeon]
MVDQTFLQYLIENPKKISELEFSQIEEIFDKAQQIVSNEQIILDLNIKDNNEFSYVIGDIHGNLSSLLYFIEKIEKYRPNFVLFLGDIVDRGEYQLECLILILALKILSPDRIFIIRGNHESIEINKAYGFYHEFTQRFFTEEDFNKVLSLYDVFPICAKINNSILCVHGGIPKDFSILKKIENKITSELNVISKEDRDNLFQILWNDPKEGLKGFSHSYRGKGIYFFGEDVFNNFLEVNDLNFLIRSHECFPEGFRWFFNKRLLSIFSSAGYRGANPASFAIIKGDQIFPENTFNLKRL